MVEKSGVFNITSTASITGRKVLTNEEIKSEVLRLAASVLERGLREGHVAGVAVAHQHNHYAYHVMFLRLRDLGQTREAQAISAS